MLAHLKITLYVLVMIHLTTGSFLPDSLISLNHEYPAVFFIFLILVFVMKLIFFIWQIQRHLPGALLKELTATEDQFYSGFINTRYLLSLSLEQVNGQKMISGHLQNELSP